MFAWFQRLLPRTGDFFGMFEAHAATLVGASDALTKLADGGTARKQFIAEIDRQEHAADDIIRQVFARCDGLRWARTKGGGRLSWQRQQRVLAAAVPDVAGSAAPLLHEPK